MQSRARVFASPLVEPPARVWHGCWVRASKLQALLLIGPLLCLPLLACGSTPTGSAPPRAEPVASPSAKSPEPPTAERKAQAAQKTPVQPPPRWVKAQSWEPGRALVCPSSKEETDARSVGVMLSSDRPASNVPLSLLVAIFGDESLPQLQVRNAKGAVIPLDGRVRSGIPAIADVDLDRLPAGRYEVLVAQGGKVVKCHNFRVSRPNRRPLARTQPKLDRSRMWKTRRSWTPQEEALYSAWIVMLFDGESSKDLAWKAMHEVTRDPQRNWLWNRQAWGEDGPKGLSLKPDCADTPYFLRAYFAWKRGLPMAFHRCDRGSASRAPRCRSRQDSQEPPIYRKRWLSAVGDWPAYNQSIKQSLREGIAYPKYEGKLKVDGPLPVLNYFFSRTLGWGVHTGNGRVAWNDQKNDFYPVALTRENLRPGTIYADPYGHILMLVDMHRGAPGEPGVLFAVDGQPDASITRKRFWQGNFLWNADPALGGSGFKAFRPLLREKDGQIKMLQDKEIARRPGYAKKAGDLRRFSKVAFYDHMEQLITPEVVEPQKALRQLVEALAEAVRIRVRSVQNGLDWIREHPAKTIQMPEGFKLFETTGPWENFSTPARDLRLLIAIDAVLDFPKKVARTPEAYGVRATQVPTVQKELGEALGRMLAEPGYRIQYQNSEEHAVALSLAQVVGRAAAYEMAYNPNDCPEIRWGAQPSSPEASSCKRRAPAAQQKQMQRYRAWFSERRRPARGEMRPRKARL